MPQGPERTSKVLQSRCPEDGSYQVSHETIYRSLFVQVPGVLKKELLRHLPIEVDDSSRHASTRIGEYKSRTSSRSGSDRRRSKIGPSLVAGPLQKGLYLYFLDLSVSPS